MTVIRLLSSAIFEVQIELEKKYYNTLHEYNLYRIKENNNDICHAWNNYYCYCVCFVSVV